MPEINRRRWAETQQGPKLSTIIFDMDGTLVSTLPVIFHCENEISTKYLSRKMTLENVISKFGPPAQTIIRQITHDLPEATQEKAVLNYYDCYRRNVSKRGLVFPGVTELLERIRSSGKHLALVTGVEKVMMEYTLNPFNLARFFEAFITSDDVQRSKPDPEGLILALRRVKSQPEECIYIGDSPADMIAGRKARVRIGAALWGPENRGDPSKENPNYQFRSVQQLSEFLFPTKRSYLPPYLASDSTV